MGTGRRAGEGVFFGNNAGGPEPPKASVSLQPQAHETTHWPVKLAAKIGCFAGRPDPNFGTAEFRRSGQGFGQNCHFPAYFILFHPGCLPGRFAATDRIRRSPANLRPGEF
jgi:hypothetical protein